MATPGKYEKPHRLAGANVPIPLHAPTHAMEAQLTCPSRAVWTIEPVADAPDFVTLRTGPNQYLTMETLGRHPLALLPLPGSAVHTAQYWRSQAPHPTLRTYHWKIVKHGNFFRILNRGRTPAESGKYSLNVEAGPLTVSEVPADYATALWTLTDYQDRGPAKWIENRRHASVYMKSDQGRPIANSVAGYRGWKVEPVDGGFVRLRSGDNYLHMEQGPIALGCVPRSYWTSHWKLGKVDGGFVRIRNRFRKDLYLNIENSPLTATEVPARYMTSHWKVTNAPPVQLFKETLVVPKSRLGAYYTELQFKTAADQYLRMGENGVAGGDSANDDDLRRWLFVPRGDGTYWIFNKGSREGTGQALALPDGGRSFGRWDFIDEPRQQFEIKTRGSDDKITLLSKLNGDALTTSWNGAADAWAFDKNKDEQVLNRIRGDAVKCTDPLIAYLFWNVSNPTVRAYVEGICGHVIPSPTAIKIKKFVFVNNNKNAKVIPVVHRHGCGGEVWRRGLAQCWWKEMTATGETAEFEVSNYLENADAIWGVITQSVVAIVVIGTTFVTGGTASGPMTGLIQVVHAASIGVPAAVLSTAIGGGPVREIGGASGHAVGQALVGAIPVTGDIVAFAWVVGQIGGSTAPAAVMSVDPRSVTGQFGLTKELAIEIDDHAGKHMLAVKGEQYQELTKDWYLEDAATGVAYDRMFFSEGTAIMISSVPDGPIPKHQYRIEAKHSGNSWAVKGAGRGEGTEILESDTAAYADQDNMEFELENTPEGVGLFYIKAIHSGKYLSLGERDDLRQRSHGQAGTSKHRGEALDIFKFALEDAGDGYVYIRVADSGGYIYADDTAPKGAVKLKFSGAKFDREQYKFKFVQVD